MPRKTTQDAEVVDVLADPADLLANLDATTAADQPAPVVTAAPVAPPPVATTRVATTPVALTPDQQRIKELEDLLAKERGGKEPEPVFEDVEPGETVTIHIVSEGGFTALGEIWFRGQELEFNKDAQSWRDTCDRNGRSWLTMDENEQIDRFGEVKFRPGPWPGKSYDAATGASLTHHLADLRTGAQLSGPSEEQLAEAAAKERNRRRSAPRLPTR